MTGHETKGCWGLVSAMEQNHTKLSLIPLKKWKQNPKSFNSFEVIDHVQLKHKKCFQEHMLHESHKRQHSKCLAANPKVPETTHSSMCPTVKRNPINRKWPRSHTEDAGSS